MNKDSSAVRPLARFIARSMDHALYGGLLLLVMPVFDIWLEGVSFYLFFIGEIVFLESFLLSKWGYTPAKYLFAIKIRTSNFQKLSFKSAVKRTWRVLFRGLGLMIPIVSIFTALNAYVLLTG